MNRDIFTDEFGDTGTPDDGDSTSNDSIDLGVFYDDIWELHADQADDGVLNPSNVIHNGGDVEYCDNSRFAACAGITFQGASADNTSFTSENTGVVCFCTGILTPNGEVPIELVIWSSPAITTFSPLSGSYRADKTLMRPIHLSRMRGGKARVMQGCRKVRYAI